MIRSAVPWLAALGLALTGAAPTPAPPSAADFGALPTMAGPVLSPGGLRLAARTQVDGKPRLLVADVATGARTLLALPDKFDAAWYRWAGDGTVLAAVGARVIYPYGIRYVEQMFAFDVATRQVRPVAVGGHNLGGKLIYTDPAGAFILVAAQRDPTHYPSVYRVDLATGTPVEIVPPHDHVRTWVADSAGAIRTGIGSDGGKWWRLYRHADGAEFTKGSLHDIADKQPQIDTVLVGPGTDLGYALATGASGRFGVYRYDLAADRLGALVYEHPTADVTDAELSRAGELLWARYTDDRERTRWFDPALAGVQAKLDKALPGLSVRIASMSEDRSRMIVWATSATSPGGYYLFDRAAGRLVGIAQPYEKLAGKPLADMASVTYPARDGLPIPAYLTLPAGRPATALPLVVMPHGGPYARDEWGYQVWTQFLASRGYVVLQPNFRGSTGYGRAFVEKGDGQWGRGMQDDVDDGVKWLAARGTVDARRVCIMGASFGGYAAEWGAVRNPELYRCAISFAGVSDLGSQLAYDRESFAAPHYFYDWRERVQGTDGATLASLSPLKHAADLKVPLLLAHGDADTTVPIEQSRRLAEALDHVGRAPEYHVYRGEGHGFAKPEDQIDFLARVEAFLKRYNPA